MMVNLIELQGDLDKIFNRLVNEYRISERLILTESDMVNRAYYLIQESGILEKHNLAIHSELRPFDFEARKAIHGEKWSEIKQINHAGKFDLTLVDALELYWNQAFQHILDIQSKNKKKKRIRYWRFLVYPLRAFKAVIEFKIRVHGNKDNIMKDVQKLSLIHEKNKCCLTYLIILDRKASDRTIQTLIEEIGQREGIQLITFKPDARARK